MSEQLEAMRLEVAALKAEKEKLEEVAAEVERGTAKGRTYEEAVVRGARRDRRRAGRRLRRGRRRQGRRRQEGRRRRRARRLRRPGPRAHRLRGQELAGMSKKQALADLDEAMAHARRRLRRSSSSPSDDKLPAQDARAARVQRQQALRRLRPRGRRADRPRGRLQARPRARAHGPRRGRRRRPRGDRARRSSARVGAMEDVRRVKSQLTQAKTSIDEATSDRRRRWPANVRGHLGQIDALLREAEEDDDVALIARPRPGPRARAGRVLPRLRAAGGGVARRRRLGAQLRRRAVEAWFEGPAEAVEAMVEWARSGPSRAEVVAGGRRGGPARGPQRVCGAVAALRLRSGQHPHREEEQDRQRR